MLSLRNIILEMIAKGADLKATIDRLCQEIESLVPDLVCSVLTVDHDGIIHPLAAPSLPDDYSAAFDGLMDKAAITTDLAARAGILRDAETLVMADQPIAPLYFAVNRNLVRARVKGWLQNPTDVHPSRYLSVEAP